MSSIHSSESELHYCLLCPKTFYGVNHLNEHLSGHRLNVSDFNSVESIIHSTCWPNGDKSIKCMICMLEFQSLAELNEHYSPTNPQNLCAAQHSIANYTATNQKGFELHLELDSETETDEKAERDDDARVVGKPYICSICNVSCERKYQMAQHQRSMHNYETLPLKCTHCIFRTVCQVRNYRNTISYRIEILIVLNNTVEQNVTFSKHNLKVKTQNPLRG